MSRISPIQAAEPEELSYHRFSQHAMATVFEIIIDHDDGEYAKQAAYAAFGELIRLEQELSRYDESSDITRINISQARCGVPIGLDSLKCLQLAEHFFYKTNGAFDVTAGQAIDCWKTGMTANLSGVENHNFHEFGISLNEKQCTAIRLHENVLVDLGGIGKGYALDCMKQLLFDWDIERVLLHSGWSTVLALSPPQNRDGWLLSYSHPQTGEIKGTVSLAHQAISGSGMQKGKHIINPQTGQAVSHTLAAWVMAKDAASADALSTSCMILSQTQREELLQIELQNGFWFIEHPAL